MNLCIDCRFFGRNFGFGDFCVRDSVISNEQAPKVRPQPSPVDGKLMAAPGPKYSLTVVALDYRMTGDCGMEGVFFEPRK